MRINCNNIAQLRAAYPVPTGATIASVGGYYSVGDGGEGEFEWDGSSTATENGGTVIKPTAVGGAGRWLRIHDQGQYNVKWFGAVGDGTTHPLSGYFGSLGAAQAVYPFATSLTNEVDWAAAMAATRATQAYYPDPTGTGRNCFGGEVLFPRGEYLHDSPITPESGEVFFFMAWRGIGTQGAAGSANIGGSAFIIYTGQDDRYFDLRSAATCNFSDMTFWYNNANFAGKILFDCTWMPGVSADAAHLRWERCSFAGDPATFSSGQGAKALISLHLAIICDVINCNFGQAIAGIRFREFPIGGQAYSNKHNIRGCTFNYEQWNLVNPGETIYVDGCTFEGLGGYTEASIAEDIQRTKALPSTTFQITGGGTQTIELIDSAGRTWADFGFAVGMTPFLLDRVNRVNGVNNLNLGTITALTGTLMTVPGSGLTTQTNTWGRIQASTIASGQPGGYAEASPGVALTFSASGKTITRDNGSFYDDNWVVNSSQIAVSGTVSNDGVYGPITTISLDGKTITIASATFVDETASECIMAVTSACGPIQVTSSWFGDQFLPGSTWVDMYNPVNSMVLEGNAMVGGTRIISAEMGMSFCKVAHNTLSSVLEPIYIAPTGPGWGNVIIQGNGSSMALFDPDGLAHLSNLVMMCNGQYANDVLDLLASTVKFQALTTIGGNVNPATIGDNTTYALRVSQGSGTTAIGGDADGPFIRFFGTARINPGDTYTGIGITAVPSSVLQVNGAIATPTAAVQTISFNVGYTVSHYPIDATSGNVTATLPAASSCPGRQYTFERVDSTGNTVTIAGTLGGDHTLADATSRVEVKSDGTNWRKLRWQ